MMRRKKKDARKSAKKNKDLVNKSGGKAKKKKWSKDIIFHKQMHFNAIQKGLWVKTWKLGKEFLLCSRKTVLIYQASINFVPAKFYHKAEYRKGLVHVAHKLGIGDNLGHFVVLQEEIFEQMATERLFQLVQMNMIILLSSEKYQQQLRVVGILLVPFTLKIEGIMLEPNYKQSKLCDWRILVLYIPEDPFRKAKLGYCCCSNAYKRNCSTKEPKTIGKNADKCNYESLTKDGEKTEREKERLSNSSHEEWKSGYKIGK
eukprot:bmy_17800T0